jgi:hypothetical protein
MKILGQYMKAKLSALKRKKEETVLEDKDKRHVDPAVFSKHE